MGILGKIFNVRQTRSFTGAEILETPDSDYIERYEIIIHAVPGGAWIESIFKCLNYWIKSVIKCFMRKDS